MNYRITHPDNPRLHLRLAAQTPEAIKETGLYECRLQVVEGGEPIAEDPIAEDYLTEAELAAWLAETIADGWTITAEPEIVQPDLTPAEINRIRCADYRSRQAAKRAA